MNTRIEAITESQDQTLVALRDELRALTEKVAANDINIGAENAAALMRSTDIDGLTGETAFLRVCDAEGTSCITLLIRDLVVVTILVSCLLFLRFVRNATALVKVPSAQGGVADNHMNEQAPVPSTGEAAKRHSLSTV